MPGPSFTELKYPDYKPSADLDIVKQVESSQSKTKLRSIDVVKSLNEQNNPKAEIKKMKEPISMLPEQSPEDDGEGEVDSELERMYAEYSREVDERLNFGNVSESEAQGDQALPQPPEVEANIETKEEAKVEPQPEPEKPQKKVRPQTAKPTATAKPQPVSDEEEGEELDPELEKMYAEYAQEVEERVNFGHNSSSADQPSEEIEYDPEQDDDEEVKHKMEELERKMTEIRNKKPLNEIEESVDMPESSVEYNPDSDISSEGEERQTKINLNHKITIKDLAEKYKHIDDSDKSDTIDMKNEELKILTRFYKQFDEKYYYFNILYNELDDEHYFWDEGFYKVEYKEDLDDNYQHLIVKPKDIITVDDIQSGNFDQNMPFQIDFKQLIYEYG